MPVRLGPVTLPWRSYLFNGNFPVAGRAVGSASFWFYAADELGRLQECRADGVQLGARIAAIGGFIGWLVAMLGFFGIDAKAIEKAWGAMSTHYVFAILAVIFFLIFVVALYYLRKSSRITPENVEPRITEWLDAFGLTRQRLAEPSCHFAYRVVVQTNIPLVVLRTRSHDHYLTFVANVSFTPEEKTLFDNLTEPKKEEFIREMRLEAAKAKIATSLDRASYIWTIERRVPITAELTEADFMGNIDEVNYSVLIMVDTIATVLGRRQEGRPPAN